MTTFLLISAAASVVAAMIVYRDPVSDYSDAREWAGIILSTLAATLFGIAVITG